MRPIALSDLEKWGSITPAQPSVPSAPEASDTTTQSSIRARKPRAPKRSKARSAAVKTDEVRGRQKSLAPRKSKRNRKESA